MFNKLKTLPAKYSLPLLLVFVALLYLVTNKVIVPFVLKVVESDLFFVKDDEQEELGKISNQRTDFALAQCKRAMKEDKQVPETAQFDDSSYEAWALGGKSYVIRSHVSVPDETKGIVNRKYACKIQFEGGEEGNADNWSILGIDFNEPTED
ncbi:MAG: hypothetical protein H6R26_1437 [Proteobacteria bacterium]|nr:hypothetical protein [Pseudomonadota bacterium]